MVYKAWEIAKIFIKMGINDGKPLTQMKLQKVLYFAQGIHLAMYDEPLISENFQAWRFGPVIPILYDVYKMYGSQPITRRMFSYTDLVTIELNKQVKKTITTIRWAHSQKCPVWRRLSVSAHF